MTAPDPHPSLTAAAALAVSDAAAAIDSLPWLAASLAEDRAADAFSIWGSSTVIDENTGAPVIGEELFDELHRRAGIAASWPVGNAGLLHCYGYLLSLAQTPYGLKRERWLTPDLARSCSLDDDHLTPWTPGATLMARVASLMTTAFASRTDERADVTLADGTATEIVATSANGEAAVHYRVNGLLITTFPVGASAEPTLASVRAEAPRLRWNAVA